MDKEDEIIGGTISIDITEEVKNAVSLELGNTKRNYFLIGMGTGIVVTVLIMLIFK